MSKLSVSEKRELLKKIMKGDIKKEELLKDGKHNIEMWAEDESDPEYMRMFYPFENKRMKKSDYELRIKLTKSTHLTLNVK